MLLYRVLPYLPRARRGHPFHPLFVPPSVGSNRVDNPELYDALYAGDAAAGAVAEAFGWRPVWAEGMLRGPRTEPASVQALVEYDADDDRFSVCDLDDAARLVTLALRPSQVVTRDRQVTQAWAARLFGEGAFAGVRWWSYYDPQWGSLGLWDVSALRVRQVTPLTLDHPAVVEAAGVLSRPLR
jgi:hypothetical protein